MKQVFRTRISSLSLFFVSLSFVSCVGVSRFSSDTFAARDKDRKAFVQTIDGTVTEADEVKLKSPFIGKSTLQLDGDAKIPVKEVLAYQNNTAYYRRIDGQFAPRIRKGLINMYQTVQTRTEFDHTPTGRQGMRTRTVYYYWLQKGDNSQAVLISPDVTEAYVRDYAPAMEHMTAFRRTQRNVKTWSLINTAAVVGGMVLATQGVKNEKLNSAGYASVPLFAGGIVSGIVNKVRRGRNHRNLGFAIDEYNMQVKRKR